jgi:antirestriction protein ArdC
VSRLALRARPVVLISGAALIAGIGITVVQVSRPTSPSYPHAWCAPLLAELYTRPGGQLSFQADLARLERRDHAPVGKLIADLRAYSLAHALEAEGDDLNPFANISATTAALRVVRRDLRALNTACGQPAQEARNDKI